MKTKFKVFAVILCAIICALSLTSCNRLAGQSNLLGSPKTVESVDYSALTTDGYKTFKNSVEDFAAYFAEYSYADYNKQDNFAVSPISVYMALALASECAAGETRQEILDALGVTREQLTTHFSTLYQSLAVERKVENKTTALLKLSNSIWVNEGTEVKPDCIDTLSNNYYAYSYSADFAHKNAEANKAVRDFIKKQTKGLIDKDFELPEETLFTLINALYLKTIWNTDGRDLPFAEDSYDFTAKDGTVKNTKLLQGYYNGGRIKEFDTFKTFFTTTHNNYKIKFILPKDGYTVNDVFTAENISAVNSITDYGFYDEAADTCYETRVLFPEYKCKYDEDVVKILQDKFGIDLLFKDPFKYSEGCDFSTLSDEPCYCVKVHHVTDLTVNRKGIEGAAVTVIPGAGAAAPMVTVYEDFIVDKAFGFIITDPYGVTLFSGVINNI